MSEIARVYAGGRSVGPFVASGRLAELRHRTARASKRRITCTVWGSVPKRGERQRLLLVQGLAGVGPRLAARLLSQFGTVEKVMRATEVELAKVPGCGPRKAAAIRSVLGGV